MIIAYLRVSTEKQNLLNQRSEIERFALQKNINIELAEETLQYLSQKGFSPKYGARPIAGVIRTYLKKTVSRLIVSEEIKPGDNIIVNFRNNELVWELR